MRLQRHLSDHDLVLAIDGELSVGRQAVVEAHLFECASCRGRRTRLDRGARLAAALSRVDPLDPGRVDASREKLRRRLADMARRENHSMAVRLASAFSQRPRWAAMAAAALAVVLLVRVLQPGEGPLSPSDVSIEPGARPVASLTPGATWNVTAEELCSPDGRTHLPVSAAIRAEVVHRYGMERVPSSEYELDYLITPELGGAPDVQNLWPQRYASLTWNALVKDQLEQLLPTLVCDGTVRLEAAQREIARDWIAAYKKYFQTDLPLRAHAATSLGATMPSADDDLLYPVWRSAGGPALRLVSFSASR